jgi:hypothetical protein
VKPGRVVENAFFGDQQAAVVDDGDVVMGPYSKRQG